MTRVWWWLLDLVETLWLDRQRLVRILRLLTETEEETPAKLVPERCAIHKLARRTESRMTDLRGGFEADFGAFTRLYVADGAPDAVEGKPQRLYAFGPLHTTPFARIDSEGPFLRNGRSVLHPAPGPRLEGALQRHAVGLAAQPAGAPLMASLPPLGGGFVPVDLPVPPAGTPRPPAPAAAPPSSCNPVHLFYGLCFQDPAVTPEEAPPGMLGDPLWTETTLIGGNFAVRGYRKWQMCAGTAAGQAADFDALMDAMAADLATQTAFCNCADDQLVIFIAGHGYGANPTGEVAILFQPEKGTKEWVAWSKLLDRLAKLIVHPAKTYLIIDSCRSGLIFEPGRVPGPLRGLHVLTCTADQDTLGACPHFGGAVADAVGQLGAVNWQHFLELVKWKVSQWGPLIPLPGYPPYGLPRHGDLGCRFQVLITTATYSGTDIGNSWEYHFEIAGREVDIADHQLAVNTSETLALVAYDRLHERCPSPPVDLVLRCDATETTGRNTRGRSLRPIQRPCDGGSQSYTLPVAVGQATLTFTVQVNTTC